MPRAGPVGQLFRPRFSRNQREVLTAFAFLSPSLVGFFAFFVLPIGASLALSFVQWDILSWPNWVGLENFRNLLADPAFLKALWNTFYFTFGSIPLAIMLSLPLAVALNGSFRGRTIYRIVYFLPVVAMMVAVSMVWRWLYNPQFGVINYYLGVLGLPKPQWLQNVGTAMPALILMSAWKVLGYDMVLFLAGLQTIPRELHEAAALDGAGRWRQFRQITLPLLSPTLLFVLVISAISSFQVFDQIYIMTGGGPGYATMTVVYDIYITAFQQFQMGYASAQAWVLFAVILIATLVQFNLSNRWAFYGD